MLGNTSLREWVMEERVTDACQMKYRDYLETDRKSNLMQRQEMNDEF